MACHRCPGSGESWVRDRQGSPTSTNPIRLAICRWQSVQQPDPAVVGVPRSLVDSIQHWQPIRTAIPAIVRKEGGAHALPIAAASYRIGHLHLISSHLMSHSHMTYPITTFTSWSHPTIQPSPRLLRRTRRCGESALPHCLEASSQLACAIRVKYPVRIQLTSQRPSTYSVQLCYPTEVRDHGQHGI